MKNFIKLISSVALIAMFSFALSSYDSVQPLDDPGNGVIVEVVKNQLWFLNACGTSVESSTSTSQYKNGELHMRTLHFDLPDGHCLIPEKGTNKFVISGHDAIVTPSGRMNVKLIIN